MERFTKRFTVTQPTACWEWNGRRRATGYGVFDGKGAHRFSYTVHVGPIPDGLHVLHRCDNPPCVNPDHLWLGTQADNMRDMREKGRDNRTARSRGEAHHAAKLTAGQVADIRARFIAGINASRRGNSAALAEAFGVTQATIQNIARRKAWKHI